MKRLMLAISFLTVFPFKKAIGLTEEDLAGSMAYFPLVGAMQGLMLLAVDYAFSRVLSHEISSVMVIAALILSNNGLHVDGFADTVDGIAGGATKEERLRIMRDSSVGAIGVAFTVLLLLVKFLALKGLPTEVRWQAIFLFPVFGRWAMVEASCLAGYAREEGVGRAFSRNSPATLLWATIFTTGLGLLLLEWKVFIMGIAAIAVSAYLLALFFKKKIGGVTGDVYGFMNEFSEALFLLIILASGLRSEG
ncbi:MAG: adenosylcobinamide-GDP ribazoletransferase [Deltaproteobacteria bacterium]